jgi:hypothetical protein
MMAVPGKILDRIQSRGRGNVFTSKDFIDLGTREAVDQALSRLARAGTIKRLGRGLYHYPQVNETLGIEVAPDADEIARALARKTRNRLIPSGAVAANALGLTTQVPARPVYLTDGRTRQVRVGNRAFTVKHAAAKDLPLSSPTSVMVFQALRHLGKEVIDGETIARLRRRLSAKERQKLLEDARYATGWVAEVVRQVAAEEPQEAAAHG